MGRRPFIQTAASLFSNGYLTGFFNGKIFTGSTKLACVPGLNCYSCPAALGSCPIGAFQAVVGGKKHNFTFYVSGILLLFGVIFARFVCGFLCPFGFIQDLLYKIPLPRLKNPKEKEARIKVPLFIDKPLRYLKYLMLILPVALLPVILTNKFGIGDPFFCKWVCPVGLLEGGIPLVLKNESLRNVIGFLFNWKMGILLFVILSSIFIYRPFCKYLCPLGAFYALFNSLSFYRMDLNILKCTRCGVCEKACHMHVKIIKPLRGTKPFSPADKLKENLLAIASPECVRCQDCKNACPHGAISSGWKIPTAQPAPLKKA